MERERKDGREGRDGRNGGLGGGKWRGEGEERRGREKVVGHDLRQWVMLSYLGLCRWKKAIADNM